MVLFDSRGRLPGRLPWYAPRAKRGWDGGAPLTSPCALRPLNGHPRCIGWQRENVRQKCDEMRIALERRGEGQMAVAETQRFVYQKSPQCPKGFCVAPAPHNAPIRPSSRDGNDGAVRECTRVPQKGVVRHWGGPRIIWHGVFRGPLSTHFHCKAPRTYRTHPYAMAHYRGLLRLRRK